MCYLCDGLRPSTGPLCYECQETYGKYADWPQWVKETVATQRRFENLPYGITRVPDQAEVQACEYNEEWIYEDAGSETTMTSVWRHGVRAGPVEVLEMTPERRAALG